MRDQLIERVEKYLRSVLTEDTIEVNGMKSKLPGMLQGDDPHYRGAAADIADQIIDQLDIERRDRIDRNATAALAGLTAANRYNKADPYTVARKAYLLANRMEEARTKVG